MKKKAVRIVSEGKNGKYYAIPDESHKWEKSNNRIIYSVLIISFFILMLGITYTYKSNQIVGSDNFYIESDLQDYYLSGVESIRFSAFSDKPLDYSRLYIDSSYQQINSNQTFANETYTTNLLDYFQGEDNSAYTLTANSMEQLSYNDGNELTYSTKNKDLMFYWFFNGIEMPNDFNITINIRTIVANKINVQIYNPTTSTYSTIGTFNTIGDVVHVFHITNTSNYIDSIYSRLEIKLEYNNAGKLTSYIDQVIISHIDYRLGGFYNDQWYYNLNTTQFSDGYKNLTMKTWNLIGDSREVSYSVLIDNTNPIAQINATQINNEISIGLGLTDNIGLKSYRVEYIDHNSINRVYNSSEITGVSQFLTINDTFLNGSYTFYVYTYDLCGNLGIASTNVNFFWIYGENNSQIVYSAFDFPQKLYIGDNGNINITLFNCNAELFENSISVGNFTNGTNLYPINSSIISNISYYVNFKFNNTIIRSVPFQIQIINFTYIINETIIFNSILIPSLIQIEYPSITFIGNNINISIYIDNANITASLYQNSSYIANYSIGNNYYIVNTSQEGIFYYQIDLFFNQIFNKSLYFAINITKMPSLVNITIYRDLPMVIAYNSINYINQSGSINLTLHDSLLSFNLYMNNSLKLSNINSNYSYAINTSQIAWFNYIVEIFNNGSYLQNITINIEVLSPPINESIIYLSEFLPSPIIVAYSPSLYVGDISNISISISNATFSFRLFANNSNILNGSLGLSQYSINSSIASNISYNLEIYSNITLFDNITFSIQISQLINNNSIIYINSYYPSPIVITYNPIIYLGNNSNISIQIANSTFSFKLFENNTHVKNGSYGLSEYSMNTSLPCYFNYTLEIYSNNSLYDNISFIIEVSSIPINQTTEYLNQYIPSPIIIAYSPSLYVGDISNISISISNATFSFRLFANNSNILNGSLGLSQYSINTSIASNTSYNLEIYSNISLYDNLSFYINIAQIPLNESIIYLNNYYPSPIIITYNPIVYLGNNSNISIQIANSTFSFKLFENYTNILNGSYGLSEYSMNTSLACQLNYYIEIYSNNSLYDNKSFSVNILTIPSNKSIEFQYVDVPSLILISYPSSTFVNETAWVNFYIENNQTIASIYENNVFQSNLTQGSSQFAINSSISQIVNYSIEIYFNNTLANITTFSINISNPIIQIIQNNTYFENMTSIILVYNPILYVNQTGSIYIYIESINGSGSLYLNDSLNATLYSGLNNISINTSSPSMNNYSLFIYNNSSLTYSLNFTIDILSIPEKIIYINNTEYIYINNTEYIYVNTTEYVYVNSSHYFMVSFENTNDLNETAIIDIIISNCTADYYLNKTYQFNIDSNMTLSLNSTIEVKYLVEFHVRIDGEIIRNLTYEINFKNFTNTNEIDIYNDIIVGIQFLNEYFVNIPQTINFTLYSPNDRIEVYYNGQIIQVFEESFNMLEFTPNSIGTHEFTLKVYFKNEYIKEISFSIEVKEVIIPEEPTSFLSFNYFAIVIGIIGIGYAIYRKFIKGT